MQNADFIEKSNIDMIWEIMADENFSSKLNISLDDLYKYTVNEIRTFYRSERHTKIPLIDMNKRFISHIFSKIQTELTKPDTTQYSSNELSSKPLITSQDIQSDRMSVFEKALEDKRNEFTNSMSRPVPKIPNFTESIDTPIKELDNILNQTIARRDSDINNIYMQTPKSTQHKIGHDQSSNVKYIKIGDVVTTDIPVLDSNNIPDDVINVKKKISWGTNNVTEFNDYSSGTTLDKNVDLFMKLKPVSPSLSSNANNTVNANKTVDVSVKQEILNTMYEHIKALDKKMDLILEYLKD
jgi:hypothetical protein